MTGDLVRRDATDTWVDLMGPIGELASQIARTEFVPKNIRGNVAATAATIFTGREMGLGPMASLRGVQVIEGKPSLTEQMLAARILAAGHRIEWKASTDDRATVRIERADGLSEAEATWTMRDAQRAGLANKQVWKAYPRHMLRARALTEAAGMCCPDVALGLDVSAGADAIEQARPATTTTVVQVTRPEPVEPAETVAAIDPAPVADDVAEAIEDEPPRPDPEPERRMVTPPQIRKIGAMLGDLERMQGQKIIDKDERRKFIAQLAGVEPSTLASANDLTAEQASTAIDALADLLSIGSELVVDDQGVIVDA